MDGIPMTNPPKLLLNAWERLKSCSGDSVKIPFKILKRKDLSVSALIWTLAMHDVSQTLLKATLDSVVEECVSFVGVDINICSEILLRHIAGLNANRAKNIIEWREKNGPFINREQLKAVKGLGPKSYQQCAGFIRINQEYIRTFLSQTSELAAGNPKEATNEKQGKKKIKAAANVTWQPDPLDQTCIHPESYNMAMSI